MGCETCGSGGSCGGCGGCGGCHSALYLTEPEILILETLGEVAFLPVARRVDTMEPMCFESLGYASEDVSRILEHLSLKGLVSLDFDKPLTNFDYTAYVGYPLHGSVALTARGQEVLDRLSLQGLEE